ncbi:DAK2 domain-containing protein [Roseburia hominis]|uniref:DAK2 domain-containing protein n=1 Tax=Roseburia hominis TaxID=301301 RepID=UPI002365B581|nr:DAK2 domain-containing protein [Roseburia hominis]
MEITTINAEALAKAFLAGAKNLEAKKEWINELNVFPVPDGDTGTNMSMTIMSAAKEVAAMAEPDMKSLAKAISSGSLRGARGNSGVILSQLFRGFTKVIAEYDEIDVQVLSDAFEKAVETAYKAVMKPKEGTILTVAKGMAVRAVELSEEETTDLLAFCEEVIKEGDHVLSMTPDMLPVLKQAGVVDSGGQGLMQVMKGALDSLQGKEIDYSIETPEKQPAAETGSASYNIDAQAAQEIKFAYCTQFLIMLEKPISTRQETEFKEYLESIGDSIVVVADDEIVKVHVHTNDPGLAMQRGLTYGSLTTIIIENMKLERDEKISALKEKEMQSETIEDVEKQLKGEEAPKEQEPPKEMGFISVSIGDGINEIFQGLGVDYIIEGGQTMNPSTEDMLNAIEKVNAKNIFILPNNKNIILAANQAASLVEDKKIIVIPTKTIPQGITALINYIPDSTPEENAERMSEELGTVKTGQVTYAVRDTVIDDKEIKQDDFMGIGDQGILSVGKELETTVLDMIEQLIDEDSAIVSIYYGEDAREDAANAIGEKITEAHPDVEVEVHYGGQPIYYYVISVE